MMTEWEKAEMKRNLEKKLGYPLEDVLELLESMKNSDIIESQESIRIRTTKLLNSFGMPKNILGYGYLRTAIEMAYEDGYTSLTNQLYPSVAEVYKTTATRVERAIRNAIEITWKRGDINILDKYFGYSISKEKGKATNGEFIFAIVNEFCIQDEEKSI